MIKLVLPGWLGGRESACQCGRHYIDPWFDPWLGKIPWRSAWQPTPVFLHGESHGERSSVGYRHEELDMTEVT